MNKRSALIFRVFAFLPQERNIAASFAVRQDPWKPKSVAIADMSLARSSGGTNFLRRAYVHNFIGAADSHVTGALPTWPYSRGWGYYPSGGLGIVVIVVVVVLLMGR